MFRITFLILLVFSIIQAGPPEPKSALLIIDVQNFYFPGGKAALVEPEAAAKNAAKVLDWFRQQKLPVVHVRHNFEPGGEIHEKVVPIKDEKVISKDEVNAFAKTDLLSYLKEQEVKTLVICGMQTHMCVEAATRAARDLGFDCVLISDACATRDLSFGDRVVIARDVHDTTLATLSKTYAQVTDTQSFLLSVEDANLVPN